jgi:hypothetical protein
MIDGIEPFYTRIGESIRGAMSGKWVQAWMEAVFYSDHIDYYGEYAASDESKPQSYLTGRDGRRAFEELRELFKAQSKPVWCRAHFVLGADGKFKMELGYDDCDANGNARYDAEEDLKRSRELRNRK